MWKRLKTMEKTFRHLDWSWGDTDPAGSDPSKHVIQGICRFPEGVKDVLGFIGKPFLALTIATLASMYFLGIKRGFYRSPVKENPGSFTQTGRYDSSGHCQRWSDPMDASGFRPWKYYRTGAGEEWASIDPDRISHCTSGQSFCREAQL